MLRAVMDARESRGEACSPPSGPWGDIEAYAALGDTETLYSCLDVNVPFRLVEFLWTSPTLDPYRDDPRFRAALDRRDIVGYKNWPFTTAP
jgi:hypothetical protein